MSEISNTPAQPCNAVAFTSLRTDDDQGYSDYKVQACKVERDYGGMTTARTPLRDSLERHASVTAGG